MRRNATVALVSLGLLLGTTGCDAFLTGTKLSENPNLPTAGAIQPLFVGVQAGQLVTTGSWTGLRFLKAGDRCTVNFEHLGAAEVAFEG